MSMTTDLNEHLNINLIKSLVQSLCDKVTNDYNNGMDENNIKIKYKNEYSDLDLRYPALYNMVCETGKEFNWIEFNNMINLLEKVRNNTISEESASVTFGQRMVDKYVTPNLPKQ